MTKREELIARRTKSVARGVSTRGIYAVRAENAELWDADGKRYLDFASGIAVNNTGHRHPVVMAAVAEQALAFTHTCFNVAPFEGYLALAEELNRIAPLGPRRWRMRSRWRGPSRAVQASSPFPGRFMAAP